MSTCTKCGGFRHSTESHDELVDLEHDFPMLNGEWELSEADLLRVAIHSTAGTHRTAGASQVFTNDQGDLAMVFRIPGGSQLAIDLRSSVDITY